VIHTNNHGVRILIGADRDLHRGYHGSLIGTPPDNFHYCKVPAIHFFPYESDLLTVNKFSPHKHQHLGEFLEFEAGAEVVHSARFPVLNRKAWVVDMDDFGSPIVGGRYLWNPAAAILFREKNSDFWSYLCKRARWMLSGYAHPSCKAILFWTVRAMDVARRWLEDLKHPELADSFLQKCQLLYPAVLPFPEEPVEQKWKNTESIHIVFCGLDYEVKNGALALRIFSKLARRFPNVALHYVGKVPESEMQKYREALRYVQFYPILSHRAILSLFGRSHILLHCSKAESLGMVLIEAAAAGMAVVTSKGPHMRHIEELFEQDCALLLDRNKTKSDEEEEWFVKALESLIIEKSHAQKMGYRNYHVVHSGKFSIERRNKILSAIYLDTLEHPAPTRFSVQSIPDFGQTKLFSLSSKAVHNDWLSYRKEISFTGSHLVL